MIVSTFEDNEIFAQNIGSFFEDIHYAKLDIDRHQDGWNAKIIRTELPEDVSEFERIIFCKSVLATGCTAKTILKKIVEKYNPREIIVISIVGSNEAIAELENAFKAFGIKFLLGEIDKLNKDGLLTPGIGIIEERLKVS